MGTEDLQANLTRRTTLKAIGGTVALLGASGVATAQSCECPEGTVLLAKYEVEDGDQFVFEKDGNFLNVGDHYTLTVTATNEDGEILAFTVETDGTYPFDGLTVKTGDGCFEKTFSDAESTALFDVRNFDESPPINAVSNVHICAKPRWQVDFATGQIPEPPDYGRELLMAELGTGEVLDGSTEGFDRPGPDVDRRQRESELGVTVTSDGFVDGGGSISVDFEVTKDDTVVHLAIFKKPGPDDQLKLEEQELHDKQIQTFDSGDSDTLTVDLPTVDDFVKS